MVRKVEVVPYHPTWPALFQREADRLGPLIGENLIALHHIGSTAVPGLAAKPTTDILVVVTTHTRLDARNPALEALGTYAKGENGVAGRRYYQKLAGEAHLFHMHAYETGHPDIHRHITFRDCLRAHPVEDQAYAALKYDLADKFTYQAQQYTEGKTDFIRAVDEQAAAWQAARAVQLDEC